MKDGKLAEIYEAAAERFAAQLHEWLGSAVQAVVLYGSTARGTAHAESDVDLLVVADDVTRGQKAASDLAYEINLEHEFRTLLTPIVFSAEQIQRYLEAGDPFLPHVLEEGKPLHDDGTFAGLCRSFAGTRA